MPRPSLDQIFGGSAGTDQATVSVQGANDIDSLIERYSREYGLDPNLTRAVVDTESSGNVDALSHKGATGLMQVMPETGAEIAAEIGEPFSIENLYDPETAIKYGTYYLAKQLNRFGSEDQALAAYHAGPGAVEAAITKGYRIPHWRSDDLSTTGEYVQKILRKRDSGNFSLPKGFAGAGKTLRPSLDEIFGSPEVETETPSLDEILTEQDPEAPQPSEPSVTGPILDTGIEIQPLGSDVTAQVADATGANQPFFKNENAPANVLQPEGAGPISQSLDEIISGDQLREDTGAREMPELNRANAFVEGVRSSLPTQGREVSQAFQREGFTGENVAGELVGTVGQVIAGTVPVNAVLRATAVGKSPLLTNVLTRTITAAGQRGAKDAGDVIAGKKEIEDALFDTVVESGGGAAFSIIPEIVIPSRALQPFAQAFADVVYQGGVDLLRGREDVLSKEWFVEQIPTIAASLGFGMVDATNGNFLSDQKQMRDELANALSSGRKVFMGKVNPAGATSRQPASAANQLQSNARQGLPAPPVKPEEPHIVAPGDDSASAKENRPDLNSILGEPEDGADYKINDDEFIESLKREEAEGLPNERLSEQERRDYIEIGEFFRQESAAAKEAYDEFGEIWNDYPLSQIYEDSEGKIDLELEKADYVLGLRKMIFNGAVDSYGREIKGLEPIRGNVYNTVVQGRYGGLKLDKIPEKAKRTLERWAHIISEEDDATGGHIARDLGIDIRNADDLVMALNSYGSKYELEQIIKTRKAEAKARKKDGGADKEIVDKLYEEHERLSKRIPRDTNPEDDPEYFTPRSEDESEPADFEDVTFPIEDPVKAFREDDDPNAFQTPTDELATRGAINLSTTSSPGSKEPAPFFKFLRRNFTSKGDLPEKVFKRKIERDGKVNAVMSDVRWTLRQFERAKKEAYGKTKIDQKEAFKIDAALKGEQSVESLPEPMRPIVRNMRDQIDALSRKLIDEGVAEGKLAARIKKNIGFYANRSYRVFNDPNWSKNVPEEVKNRAHAFLRKEFPDLGEKEVNGLIDELLYKEEAPISVMSRGSKLGSKNLSVFKKRKDIPQEIRALWGEYKDADVNYTQSITRMSHLLENHKFLRDIKTEGMDDFFFEAPVRNENGSFSAKISSDKSKVFEPLNGLYTSPEIKRAFEEIMSNQNNPAWLRHYMKAVATTKWAKTVGSLQTHVRNTIGNAPFAIANGHFNILKGGKALQAVVSDLRAKGPSEMREYLKEMQRLGVIHDDASTGELRDILKDAQLTDIDKLIGKKWTKLAGQTFGTINKLYQAEDDIWKMYAYENEVARYRKALKGKKSDEEIKKIAAENIRNTYPTYSMVPRAIKALRRFPVAGTFVSFPAEVIRTSFNTARLAAKELADPALKGIGSQRVAGMFAASTMTAGATALSRYLSGTSNDDDEDIREFLPPWSKNSDIIHLGKKDDGTFMYVDIGYTDPYSYLKKPVTAVMRGVKNEDDLFKVSADAGIQLLEPFISEDIFTQRVTEFRSNKKQSGAPVYNPNAPIEDRIGDVVTHFAEVIEPGTITSLRRVYRGIEDQSSNRDPGKKYDPFIEATSMTTGFRGSKADPMRSMQFKAREMTKNIASIGQVDKGKKTEREKVLVEKEYEKLDKAIGAAERLGFSKEEIRQALIKGGLSRERANRLSQRRYDAYVRQYQ